MITLPIKPLSVNEAYKGRKFRTPALRKYQRDVCLLLKDLEIPDGPLELHLEFGLSSMGGDTTNPIKVFEDCLQMRYGFNDNRVYRIIAEKRKVAKGAEYIRFEILELQP